VDAAADLRNVALAHSDKADGYRIGLCETSLTYRDILDLTNVLFRVVVDAESYQFRA
jgi:hypothetical protein